MTLVERHYQCPMEIEWAKDANTGDLFLLQARPETVHSARDAAVLRHFLVQGQPRPFLTGSAVGDSIAIGDVRVVHDAAGAADFHDGDVLVAATTSPDWVPLMKRAAAVVTDLGGRTSHAAIVSRELGVPAVVGTGNGTLRLANGEPVTVSCSQGNVGYVYEGKVKFEEREIRLDDMRATRGRTFASGLAEGRVDVMT